VSQERSIRSADDVPIRVLSLGLQDYQGVWEYQHELAEKRVRNEVADTLVLVEHPFVYTAGSRTQPKDRPNDGSSVIDVDRGGRITWHGPGQLVGYPILKLADGCDGVAVVRRIEQALIAVCAWYEVEVVLVPGRSGVWVPPRDDGGGLVPARKIAAIGMRVQRGVTLHGFSLNCNNEFRGFESIVPCGISDAGVTSLSRELGRDVPVSTVIAAVGESVVNAIDGGPDRP
jgi:lipoyl(octanoyl) transferase